MTTVLVVDDEASLVQLVRSYLEHAGYRVVTASDGVAAIEAVRAAQPDLVVLDVMLPGLDGVEVCRRLRRFSNAYVLMLTARTEEVDKIVGLAVGADDYLTKPFSPRELVARVQAMLRRPRSGMASDEVAPAPRRFGDLVLDDVRHEVSVRGAPVALTAREFALLATFAAHPGRVFTRAQLLERLWDDAYFDDHVVDVHVANLRKKIEDDPAHPRYVETVRGVGYRFGPGRGRRVGRFRAGLGAKLFVSYLLVVAVGTATLFVAADTVGPRFFLTQVMDATREGGMTGVMGAAMTGNLAPLEDRLQAAFETAMLRAHVVASLAALAAAIGLSLIVSRQVVRPLRSMVRATRRIAAGRYAERVQVGRANAGDELGKLAESFNAMATALEQTERRRTLLIGDVAHELRTPIATLQGYLEGLLDGVVESFPATWATLHDEAGRLRRLVDDLQELSRAEARQLSLVVRPVAPFEIVQATLDRVRMQFDEKGLELRATVSSDVPLVLADPGRAVQALTNLLGNALRYTAASGRVEVAVRREGSAAAFRVTDTGIGFVPEQAGQLFERFYRADPSRSRELGGSGIGLTIARALVEAMGGRMEGESPGPGRGSTFTFTLPIA